MDIEGKVQAVTGGTSGMGLSLAAALGKFGPVLIGGRNEKRLEGAIDVLQKLGVDAHGAQCDISDIDSVKSFRKAALEIGEVGSVVNAAGVDFDTASIEQIININMKGVVNVTETFFPDMDESVMVHFSSMTGYFYAPEQRDIDVWNDATAADFPEASRRAIEEGNHPQPDFLDPRYTYYAASKRFVMYYVMANVSRFGAKKSRIFSVAPGSFDTPMLRGGNNDLDRIAQGTAFKRFGSPTEMTDLIIKLMEPGHDYFTGVDVIMDGGKYAMSMAKQII